MISSFFVEIVSDILRFGTVKYSMSDRLGTVSTTGALPVAFRVRDVLKVQMSALRHDDYLV